MHILYIHQHYATPGTGRGTRSYEFAKRFAASGHEVTVLTGRSIPAALLEAETPPGVRVLSSHTPYENRMDALERMRRFASFAVSATRMGWGTRPDVIYATSTPLTVGIPGLVLRRRHEVPLVFEVRDLWPEAPIQMGVLRNPLLNAGLRRFERRVYRRAAAVIALSPGMVNGVLEAGTDPRKVHMIPNAADLDRFHPGPLDPSFLKRHGLPERPTLAYAGALGAANAVDLLIEAVARLQERRSDVQVVVAGDGGMLPALHAARTDRSLDRLHLLGRIPKDEVAALYRASVAGLVLFRDLPVLQTNSPNKFFDLLAAGRPVITNMRGWIGSLVETHQIGMAVPGVNPSRLADAMAQMGTMDAWDSMGRRARRLAETQFDRDRLAAQAERVLATAAGERSRAQPAAGGRA